MNRRTSFSSLSSEWNLLSVYEKFEYLINLLLTGLIAVIILFAVWNLILKVGAAVGAPDGFDPTDYTVFQAIFGAIFTVIIALEFKRSLLVVAERRESVVHVRAVVLIALLAIIRKILLLELSETNAMQLVGLAAAILALGAVYWLVREQDHALARDLSENK